MRRLLLLVLVVSVAAVAWGQGIPSSSQQAIPDWRDVGKCSWNTWYELVRDSIKQSVDSVASTYADGPLHNEGALAFAGGVMLPDGDTVLLCPFDCDYIGIYSVSNNAYSRGPAAETTNGAFYGGSLILAGTKVFLNPRASNYVGLYAVSGSAYTRGPILPNTADLAYGSGITMADGNVILPPFVNNASAALYFPGSNTIISISVEGGAGTTRYSSCAMLPSGKILFVPWQHPNVGLLDTNTRTFTTGPAVVAVVRHSGAVVAANGIAYMTPTQNTRIGAYDEVNNTYSIVATATWAASDGYYQCSLSPAGNVIFSPYQATETASLNPTTDVVSKGPAHGKNKPAFFGIVALPTGKMLLVPASSDNIGIFDPQTGSKYPLKLLLSPWLNKL